MLQLRDIAARSDKGAGLNTSFTALLINLTKRERATILATLRRWLSYPAAREADSIATCGGKHQPLDNAEIERLCKRITKMERKRAVVPLLRQPNNGAPASGRRLKLRDDMLTAQKGRASEIDRATSTATREVF